MAWSHVGNDLTAVASSGSITSLSEPAGVQPGDLIVVALSRRGSANFTTPDGWTLLESGNSSNTLEESPNSQGSYNLYYIIRGATAPSYTFARTGGDVAIAVMSVYRSDGGPITLGTSNNLNAIPATTSVDIAGPTTTAANELIILVGFGARQATVRPYKGGGFSASTNGSSSTAAPSTSQWLSRASSTTTVGVNASVGIGDSVRVTPGSLGTLTIEFASEALHSVAYATFRSAPITRRPIRTFHWL